MMNKFAKAFTIVEMLVVMILGAIVSALSYQAVLAVSGLYQNFEKRQRQVQEITSWYSIFYKDIANAEKIESTQGRLVVVEGEHTTVFRLTSNALIREQETTKDSIPLVDGKFLKNACDSSALMYCGTLTFQFAEESVQWHFHKQYSAVEVLNKLITP